MSEQLQLFGLGEFEVRDDSRCLDCDVDTIAIDEYYMLRKEVWLTANPVDAGMLCIGCVECRLGRPLSRWDFSDAPINAERLLHSERLRARLGYVRDEADGAAA